MKRSLKNVVLLLCALCVGSHDLFAENDSDDLNKLEGHRYVDLGLPSGTLWADCNVGAKDVYDAGFFISWGETKPKDTRNYLPTSYKYYKETTITHQVKQTVFKLLKYNNDTRYGVVDNKKELDDVDDAATLNWGKAWCTPTKEQMRELRDQCRWQSLFLNGKNYLKIIGKNGNYILLPVWGYYVENMVSAGSKNPHYSFLDTREIIAYYWARQAGIGPMSFVMKVGTHFGITSLNRHYGANVRAVVSSNGQNAIQNNQVGEKGYRSNTIIPRDIYVSVNGQSVPLYTLSATQIDSIADSPELDIFKYERREIAQEPSQTSPERKTQSHKVPTNSGSQNKKAIQISEEVPWRDWSIGKEDINYLYYQYGTVGNVYYLMREGNNNNSKVCGSVRFVNAAKGAISLHANPQKLTSNVYIDHELIRPVWRGTWKDNHGKIWSFKDDNITIEYVQHVDFKATPPDYVLRQHGVEHIIGDIKYYSGGPWVAAGNLFFLYAPDYIQKIRCTSHKKPDGWIKDKLYSKSIGTDNHHCVCEIMSATNNKIVLKSMWPSDANYEIILTRIK